MLADKKIKQIPFKLGRLFKSCYNSFFKGTYLSYIPDRYSDNIHKYKQFSLPFYDANNIPLWTKNNYLNNAGDLARFYFFNLVIDQLLFEEVKGSIAELGVYKGNSAVILAKYARLTNQQLFLFDTFNGFNEKDLHGSDAKNYENKFDNTSEAYVKSWIGTENVKYIKGYFPESLNSIDTRDLNFSLVHIDCDLERPFMNGLNFFYPKLVEGGFLILHDYMSLYWKGANNAINTFFRDKAEKLIPVPDKSGTVVIRKIKSNI